MRIKQLSFNRTIVELKYISSPSFKIPLLTFNRTIVELKYHADRGNAKRA